MPRMSGVNSGMALRAFNVSDCVLSDRSAHFSMWHHTAYRSVPDFALSIGDTGASSRNAERDRVVGSRSSTKLLAWYWLCALDLDEKGEEGLQCGDNARSSFKLLHQDSSPKDVSRKATLLGRILSVASIPHSVATGRLLPTLHQVWPSMTWGLKYREAETWGPHLKSDW